MKQKQINRNFTDKEVMDFVKRKSKQELEIEELKEQINNLIGDNLALQSRLLKEEKSK